MKRLIVSGLSSLCHLLDCIPTYEDGRVHRYGDWGCRLQLSAKSFDLDEKWGTGVWQDVTDA